MASASRALDRPETLTWEAAARLPWRRWLALGLSLALFVALALVLRQQGLARLRGALPASPIFWVAFAAYYLALPSSEWVIYRRVWNVPAGAIGALLRKLVSNELLLGYSGELSFYLYARRSARITSSPFTAIKDVSILSAMTGNLATLGMAALAYPIWRSWEPRLLPSGSGVSLAALLAASLLLLLLRRQIFSLPAPLLRFIAALHCARIVATTFLLGVMWTAALPQVSPTIWLGLAAWQLMVTRLPFVPNKDIVFAGSVMLLVGHDTPIASLMALIASLLVATHLVVGLGLLGREILSGDVAA